MFHTLSSRWQWCLENLLVYVCRSVKMCLWLAFTSWNASSMWQKWLNLIDMWVSIQICNRTTPQETAHFSLVTGVGITWKPLGRAWGISRRSLRWASNEASMQKTLGKTYHLHSANMTTPHFQTFFFGGEVLVERHMPMLPQWFWGLWEGKALYLPTSTSPAESNRESTRGASKHGLFPLGQHLVLLLRIHSQSLWPPQRQGRI